MTRHRSHSAAFKRQVAEEFIAGETLHALSKRHDISRQLIRIAYSDGSQPGIPGSSALLVLVGLVLRSGSGERHGLTSMVFIRCLLPCFRWSLARCM
jgi:transposase-like protein